jgi:uracil-DNA glycosylase family 4
MNIHREYFLRHMAIGEQWVLRKGEDPSQDGASERPAIPNAEPSTSPPLKGDAIETLREAISSCHQCGLCSSNGKLVLSDQVFHVDVLVIYDWSERENFDIQVGADFKRLLVSILKSITVEPYRIASMNLLNANFPVSNLIVPSTESAKFCGEFLRRAITAGKAKHLLVFGARAANALFESNLDMGQLRTMQLQFAGIPVVVTHSPYQLLTQPILKRDVWSDICRFRSSIKPE